MRDDGMRSRLRIANFVIWLGLALGAVVTAGAIFLGVDPRQDFRAIASSEMLHANGAELYLLTRGTRRDAPVILWLHGGPGGAEGPLFRLFNSALETDFVVAYWDQRGAGRSYSAAADPARLTVAQHLEDLDFVVDHLRAKFGADTIALIGHSWGSALGLLYTRRHPEKVAAFVGVGQFVSGIEGQRAQYSFVDTEARRVGDRTALTELAAIGPPPYSASNGLRAQDLVDRFGGYFYSRPSFLMTILRGICGGYIAPWEIWKFIHANNVSLQAMNDEISQLDLRLSAPSVDAPVIFMLGRHDRHVDSRIAAAYFEQLQAPSKALIWFEGAAHNIPFEQPELFNLRVTQALHDLEARIGR